MPILFRSKNKWALPPINPRLFLTLAVRQLEEAKKLEATPDYQDTVKGYKILLSLVKVFLQTFGLVGPNGQERLTPLDDKLVLLQLAEVAEEAAKAFDSIALKVAAHDVANIRSMDYYAHPQHPVNVSVATKFFRSKAEELGNAPPPLNAEDEKPEASTSTSPAPAAAESESEPTTECQVCCLSFDADLPLPDRPPTANCAHPATICKPCLSSSIESSFQIRDASRMPCPHEACSEMLTQDDVKQWATDGVYARYHMLLLRSLLRSEEGRGGLFVWCQNPTCFSGQIHAEQNEQPKVVCVQCGHATCFNHSVPWHEGKTCRQYDRTLPVKDTINRVVSRMEIWWSTRRCPGCGQRIRKNGGCRHMSCRCGFNFTWYYAPFHWRHWVPFVPRRDPRF